jgi:transposase InsO family protein
MPWSIPDLMSIRLEFVAEVLAHRQPITRLCAQYGISEKTGYKWLARFKVGGPAALVDASSRPAGCPWHTPAAQRDAVCALRRAHPTWGARKLRAVLQDQQPAVSWPAPSTITTLLHTAGLIVARRRRARAIPGALAPALTADTPNTLWTLDYKGQFTTGDGHYCYPLTLVDSASRFLLACDAHRRIGTAAVQATLAQCFRTYGLPQAILSDNGAPFASVHAPRRFSPLSAWLVQLGIRPLFTQPRHPEQNGRHERMHRTLKAEATKPPARTATAQQTRFDAFRDEYNCLRPHEALALTPPARHYHPSERPWPTRVAPLTYPAAYLVRRIAPSGVLNWHQRQIYVSLSLAGQDLGLHPVSAAHYDVYFADYLVGFLDVQTLRFTSLTQGLTSPMSPV